MSEASFKTSQSGYEA